MPLGHPESDLAGNPWLVLRREEGSLWYVNLATGRVERDDLTFDGSFSPSVRVLRGGEDVNR